MHVTGIVNDPQPIIQVITAGGRIVGPCGVTKIVPYSENEQMAEVLWLAVYRDEVIIMRMNCAAIESIYYGCSEEETP